MPYKIAIDALNFSADHRGMGRYVRHVLRDWLQDPALDVTLMTRIESDAAIVREDDLLIAHETGVRTIKQAKNMQFDAVWYPWNSLRFGISRARKLVTIYDAFAFTEPHRQLVARWKEQQPIRRAFRKADVITTISRWSATEIARISGLDPSCFAIVPPVPDIFWQPVAMRNIPEKPYFLFVGGPDKRKNAPTLFEAFARAFAGKTFDLVVAGTLSSEDETLLANLPISFERVQPSDVELRILYSGALAVAVPSYGEGYGLPAVEAMACGAPVMASDAAALPEACDGAALLVPPLDVQEWSEALQKMARNSAERGNLRERSLARAARIDRSAPGQDILAMLGG